MTNIKKFAAVAALALALVGCGNGSNTSSDSNGEKVGEATASGYGGDMKIIVTMEGEEIKDIVVDHSETEGIGADAIPELIEEIKANNSTEVDNVSGATVTSEAFKQGVDEAIKNAK